MFTTRNIGTNTARRNTRNSGKSGVYRSMLGMDLALGGALQGSSAPVPHTDSNGREGTKTRSMLMILCGLAYAPSEPTGDVWNSNAVSSLATTTRDRCRRELIDLRERNPEATVDQTPTASGIDNEARRWFGIIRGWIDEGLIDDERFLRTLHTGVNPDSGAECLTHAVPLTGDEREQHEEALLAFLTDNLVEDEDAIERYSV